MFNRDCFPRLPGFDTRYELCIIAAREENPPDGDLVTFYKCLQFLEAQYLVDEDTNMIVNNGYVVVKDYFSATIEICFLGIILKIL